MLIVRYQFKAILVVLYSQFFGPFFAENIATEIVYLDVLLIYWVPICWDVSQDIAITRNFHTLISVYTLLLMIMFTVRLFRNLFLNLNHESALNLYWSTWKFSKTHGKNWFTYWLFAEWRRAATPKNF